MIDPRTTGRDRTRETRGVPRAGTLVGAALLAVAVGVGPLPARAIATGARDSSVVLRFADRCGASLSAGESRAIEEILLARAWDAGVVVCHGGLASPGPAAFGVICAKPGSDVLPLWWDLRVETPQREGTRVASATLRLALTDGPPRGAPELFLLGPFVLSPGVVVAEAKAETLRAVTDSLRSSPALLGWLRGLAARPELLHVRPVASGSRAAPPREATTVKPQEQEVAAGMPPPSDDEVNAWKAEILRITDLLIDGNEWQLRIAEHRADRLLREEGLPPDLAARARELKEKAAAKQASPEAPSQPAASSSPVVPAPSVAPSRPAVPGPPAAAPGGDAAIDERPSAAFPARLAIIGKGFGDGAEGQLQLTHEGIAFRHKGKAAEWTLSWADLASASRDDGLWESPFTILLVDRDGRKRYLSLIDGHGHYVTGEPLLNAIAAGRKAFRRLPGKVSGEPRKQGDTP
ncbi:MAG TPA: hypothetical protein VLV54_06620 [Thermoanaerobaculia bacterium]|nr:hypothetical protein [Thermoanaerobaculia bacterium]